MGQQISAEDLNEYMEFDYVIEVHADETVSRVESGPYFELFDGELSGPDGWELMAGYSGQDRYTGPIMHDSEYIGGAMARDILTTPGQYVALAASYTPEGGEDEDEETIWEGWAVARKIAN